jgi:phosphonate transport system permease protein
MDKRSRSLSLVRSALIIALVLVALGWSYRVTRIDFPRLVRDLPKAKEIAAAFLTPDLVTRRYETTTIEVAFPIPCGSAPEQGIPASGPRLVPSVPCAAAREKFTLEGFDLAPNSEIAVRWQFPDERHLTVARTETDAEGHFSTKLEARPIASTVDGVPGRLQVDTSTPVGWPIPSQASRDVLQAIIETIFMALLATTIAVIIAAPLSFLAARNTVPRTWFGRTVYYTTRSIFNLTRSYDPLVMATIFGFWLGFGPLPGVLALTVVTIASIGKMFSEAVESIDLGPMEALTATGSNPLQVVVFAVIPQIIPDFVSYIIYHWDINVRISTIIGFVGGGGIGLYLNESINGFHYHQAGTAILAIVIVVWTMDFLSAEVRKRMA